MKSLLGTDGMLDYGAFWQLLQELEAGTLEEGQRDDLMEAIAHSPALQRAYLEYFEVVAALVGEASSYAEEGRLPVVGGQRRQMNRIFRRSVLAAAAVLVLAAVVAALIVVRQSEAAHFAASATADAQWSIDGEVQAPAETGWEIAAGSTIKVWSGVLKLDLESGAVLVMQGPARVSFPELDRPALHEGWLWIDSEEPGESFEVETPGFRVRDIGTRFGVRVSKGSPTEVHVIEGKVEVFAKSTNEMVASLEPDGRGMAIPISEESRFLDLARDPYRGLGELITGPANYPTTVRSQSPANYWRMDEDAPGLLVNEVPEGLTGRRHPKVEAGMRGPGAAVGFHGFGNENRAILIPNAPGLVPLSLGSAPVHQGLMYQEDFSGEGDLDGSTPDVSIGGERWVATPIFKQDGSVGHDIGCATLAFVPVDGVVYTLDGTVTATSRPGRPSEDWIGLGFAQGQPVKPTRFGSAGLSGRAWMLHRAADTIKPVNRAWMSVRVSDWNWTEGSPLGGTMEMRIVLDTTGGAGAWTATWYAKRPVDDRYRVVRETEVLINESITSVGFSAIARGLSASIEKFSLRAERREASAAMERHLADGSAKVARREGALSFWFQREPGVRAEEILWAAGESMWDDSIHTHLTADGRAGFFMENGRYDVLISSEEPVDDGRWHHLAASWSPSAVELYLDGKLIARDAEFRGMQQGILSGLRVGSRPASSESGQFTGWVDEVALWDRALTPAEVAHQFRSAKGNP